MSAGSIPLRFDYLELIFWAGLLGIEPAGVWFTSIALALPQPAFTSSAHSLVSEVLMGLAIAAAMVLILVCPSLVPCLILRARQPRGARLAWDSAGIIEWDGEWQRAVIPWSRASVSCSTSKAESARSSFAQFAAVQVTDVESGASITAWRDRPPGVPIIRRRLEVRASDLRTLLAALEAHVPAFSPERRAEQETHEGKTVGAPDWSRAVDPHRQRPGRTVALGRLGYVCAVFAPLLVMPSHAAGFALAIVGAGLLAWRAQPVLAELRALHAVRRELSPDEPRAEALRLRLRAVHAEAALRVAFPFLVIATTTLNAFSSVLNK